VRGGEPRDRGDPIVGGVRGQDLEAPLDPGDRGRVITEGRRQAREGVERLRGLREFSGAGARDEGATVVAEASLGDLGRAREERPRALAFAAVRELLGLVLEDARELRVGALLREEPRDLFE
jgi:hypothetical protein